MSFSTRLFALRIMTARVMPATRIYCLVAALCFLIATCSRVAGTNADVDWPEYHGGPDKNHYSPLSEITADNIDQLEPAWIYHSRDADTIQNKTQVQCNPVIVDGILYGVSAGSQVFALNAATGAELWKTQLTDDRFSMNSRGITLYQDKDTSLIFYGFGQWLYCLDAKTGKPVASFGNDGRIHLKEGIERPGADEFVVYNTPGVIYNDLLITGVRVSEGPTALHGDIRAYNVHTGKISWTFKTIPAPGEPGAETWPANGREHNGGANPWMGMAIDRDNGIVYAPTGSAAFDFYGADRKGDNLFANCLIALDAKTGKRIWHFQLVHHDIWDRDPPATPNLVDIEKDGKKIAAVAQITKQGYIFLFDRLSGKPVFPIEERAVPASEMPGEFPAATQPFPVLPEPFTRQSFTEKDLRTDAANRDSLLQLIKNSNTGEAYIPVSRKRTVFFPGSDGGAQWGGAAVDNDGVMYIPAKEIPVFTTLKESPAPTRINSAEKLYQLNCASCHGQDMTGDHSGTYPPLADLGQRYNELQLVDIINKGRGMMPSLAHLPTAEKNAIAGWLLNKKMADVIARDNLTTNPFVITGYNRWYDDAGLPVNNPPWGTLTAVDLVSGKKRWQVPLGEFERLKQKGIPPTGTDNYGGPLVTASGLIFIAATPDKKFRVFNKTNGRILWETDLPAAGFATPSTYSVGGRQYVVIACGGGKLKAASGDAYVAFALKR